MNGHVGMKNSEELIELYKEFLSKVAELEGLERPADKNESSGLFAVTILVNAPGHVSVLSNLPPEDARDLVNHYLSISSPAQIISGETLQ